MLLLLEKPSPLSTSAREHPAGLTPSPQQPVLYAGARAGATAVLAVAGSQDAMGRTVCVLHCCTASARSEGGQGQRSDGSCISSSWIWCQRGPVWQGGFHTQGDRIRESAVFLPPPGPSLWAFGAAQSPCPSEEPLVPCRRVISLQPTCGVTPSPTCLFSWCWA